MGVFSRKRDNLSAISGKRALGKNEPQRVARGKDMYGYGEQKKPLNLSLTPKAIDILDKVATRRWLSKSELIERWAREELFFFT